MTETTLENKGSRYRRFFGYVVAAMWILAFAGIIYTFTRDDLGMLVAVGAGSVVFCSLLTFGWFVVFGQARRATRLTVLLVVVTLTAAAAKFVRIEGVTGALFPRFRFSWQEKHDARLAMPAAVDLPAENGIDLATITPDDFPQFLGPHRNGYIAKPILAADWSSNPPREVWRKPIGAGWSSFAIVNGFAVTMEQRGENELVTCYDVRTGTLQWSHSVKTRHETILGGIGPRATPTIDDGLVYAQGSTGIFRCLDGRNGRLLWDIDLIEDFGGNRDDDKSVIAWGRAGSPLVVGQLVVVPVGGPMPDISTLIAFDKKTGKEIWRAGTTQISYSSPILATLGGAEQIIYVAEDEVMGVDPNDGKILWTHDWPGSSTAEANVSQPHPLDGERIFLSKGYGRGCEVIRIGHSDDAWSVDIVWSKPIFLKTKFSSAVIYDGLAFGLDDTILECVDTETGRKRWKRGRYGFGQILGVGHHLLVQAENGDVVLLDLADKFHERAELHALSQKTWNNPAVFGRYLLVRNDYEAACFELPVAEAD